MEWGQAEWMCMRCESVQDMGIEDFEDDEYEEDRDTLEGWCDECCDYRNFLKL
jgi:hypothetical protein